MSKAVEKSLGSFLNVILGSSNTGSSRNYGLKFTSMGFISFVERIETARKISKQVSNFFSGV